MAEKILGLRTCARMLGVGVDRIRRLINLKKIRPKKVYDGPQAPWVFDKHDQEIIRQHTSMKD